MPAGPRRIRALQRDCGTSDEAEAHRARESIAADSIDKWWNMRKNPAPAYSCLMQSMLDSILDSYASDGDAPPPPLSIHEHDLPWSISNF